jgi:hypothetical protein
MAGNNTRVNILVEGQTEESFVRDLLVPHLAAFQVWLTPRIVETSRGHKGGAASFGKIVRQVRQWCLQDQTAMVTTLFDVYGLPSDFPGTAQWVHSADPVPQVAGLEDSLSTAVAQTNFMPYLQLHEFEALLFSNLDAFAYFDVPDATIAAWKDELAAFGNPELLNNSIQTAPSKRIATRWPAYQGSKPFFGTLLGLQIGLPCICAMCPRFRAWVTALEQL